MFQEFKHLKVSNCLNHRPVFPKLAFTLASLDIFKIFQSSDHIPVKPQSLKVVHRYQYFLRFPSWFECSGNFVCYCHRQRCDLGWFNKLSCLADHSLNLILKWATHACPSQTFQMNALPWFYISVNGTFILQNFKVLTVKTGFDSSLFQFLSFISPILFL